MLWLYRVLFIPALLLMVPFYGRRMIRRGGYGRFFKERFGRLRSIPARRQGVRRLWVQAVSVGEVLAVEPLLRSWAMDPSVEVVLTTTTSTGRALADARYGNLTLARGYFPIDAWPFSRNAWECIRPDVAILVEGEFWPEHLAQARVRRVPVVCVNARMSDRTYRRLCRLGSIPRRLLGGIDKILASSETDAMRFREVGVRPAIVQVTGNLKLDIDLPTLSENERRQLRSDLGVPPGSTILLGSSTWKGEETALIEVLTDLNRSGREVFLLLVPRHVERRAQIVAELLASGLRYHVRSEGIALQTVDVALADTTGELRRLIQIADIVFVGKSLPPHTEGQSPIEAAAAGKPILFGPSLTNFREVSEQLMFAGAALRVASSMELKEAVRALSDDARRRSDAGRAAALWHAGNQGAVQRTIAGVSEVLRCSDRDTGARRSGEASGCAAETP